MNLEYGINESYDRLTANDREVLNRILRNKVQSAGMNSMELVAFCHMPRTILIRLFEGLGIGGFAELRPLLKKRAGMQELAHLGMEEITSSYHRMMNDFREYDYSVILGTIHEAGIIYLYDTGNEQRAIGGEFEHIFLIFGKCCIDLFDYGEIEYASRYSKSRNLPMAISLLGESENSVQVLRSVQCREIKTLSITCWTNSTMARICRYNLYAGARMMSGGGKPGYEMVVALYVLLGMLLVNYLEYERKDHETRRGVR